MKYNIQFLSVCLPLTVPQKITIARGKRKNKTSMIPERNTFLKIFLLFHGFKSKSTPPNKKRIQTVHSLLQAGRSRMIYPMKSLDLSLCLILPAAVRVWDLLSL